MNKLVNILKKFSNILLISILITFYLTTANAYAASASSAKTTSTKNKMLNANNLNKLSLAPMLKKSMPSIVAISGIKQIPSPVS